MKVYAIGNMKGGVGKTTATVNLAYSFSQIGKKVLVIDLDPQCNCTPFFTKVNNQGYSVKDVLQNPDIINQAISKSKYINIDIIKGNISIKPGLEIFSLKSALQVLGMKYDICLIDTHPIFDGLTKNALMAADVMLTPIKFDNFCRDNLAMVEDIYHEILESNQSLDWKIFANMTANGMAQRAASVDLLAKHEYPFLESCISRTLIVDNALTLYKPVMKHRSKSMVAGDFMDLAKELLEI